MIARREFRERCTLSSLASVLFEMGQNISSQNLRVKSYLVLVTTTPREAMHGKSSVTESILQVHFGNGIRSTSARTLAVGRCGSSSW